MPKRILTITIALTLAVSAAALAGPLKGKTYKGSTVSSGTSEHGRKFLFLGNTAIDLAVASNGKTVKVSFPSSYVILYCRTQSHLYSQKTKPAKISGSGSFKAEVGVRLEKGNAGEPSVKEIVSGRFSGTKVSGTIKTEDPECGGTTSFTAKA